MEITVKVPAGPERVSVLGAAERNLKMIREGLGVGVTAREGQVNLSGSRAAVVAARRVLGRLVHAATTDSPLDRKQVLDLINDESGESTRQPRGWSINENGRTVVDVEAEEAEEDLPPEWDGRLNVYAGGKALQPRTQHQQEYLNAIRENDLVFAIGPAGTGKTYLAVAAAVHLLKSGRVRRVLDRLGRPEDLDVHPARRRQVLQ